jgi:fatty acid desaturase
MLGKQHQQKAMDSTTTDQEITKDPPTVTTTVLADGFVVSVLKSLATTIRLRYYQDLKTIFYLFVSFSLQFYLWNFFTTRNIIVLVPIITTMSFGTATIVHNSMHLPIFSSSLLNRLFCLVMTIGYGHPVTTFISGHNISHHPFTQQRLDHMRTSKVRYKVHFLNLILFYFHVAGDVMKSDFKYMLLQRRLKRRGYNHVLQEFTSMLSVMIPLLYINPFKFLIIWQIPRFFASYGIVTMNILQHDGCDDDTLPDGKMNMNSARNFTGTLINFLTFNNGYHTIHHIRPGLHWSRIPSEHERVVKPFMHKALDQENMFYYIINTFVFGKRLKYDGSEITFMPVEEDTDLDWMDKKNIFKSL